MTQPLTIDTHAHYFPEPYIRLISDHGKRCGTTVVPDPSGAKFIQVGLALRTGPITPHFYDLDDRSFFPVYERAEALGLPILRGRLDRGFEIRGECRVIPRPPSEYLKRFTYDTIAYSEPIMDSLVGLVGAERIIIPLLLRRGARAGGWGGGSGTFPCNHPVTFGATPPQEEGRKAGSFILSGAPRPVTIIRHP